MLEPINAVFIVQDRDYNNKLDLVQANMNPPAYVDCTIKAYEGHVKYSMENAYTGNSFFWGLFPHAEDMVTFTFVKPIVIKRFVFLTYLRQWLMFIFYLSNNVLTEC